MSAKDPDSRTESPGWDAITNALKALYGEQEPRHFGTIMPWALGGPDPLTGISAFKVFAPVAHWHFVTFGFSELFDKESENLERSGFGFELTFRLVCPSDATEPPMFALNFLQNLGKYVFHTGNAFGVGHHMPLNGPICQGDETLIWAIAFARDPQLDPIDTPNGRVEFLQVVGLTMDELDAVVTWDTDRLLELMQRKNPLLLTDIRRQSLLRNSAFAKSVAAGVERDGSSCAALHMPLRVHIRGGDLRLVIGDYAVQDFQAALRGRLGHSRELVLDGSDCTVVLRPSNRPAWRREEQTVVIELAPRDAVSLAEELRAEAGEYALPGVARAVLAVEHVQIGDARDWRGD